VKSTLLSIALAYVSLALFAWFFSDRMIFLPPRSTYTANDLPVKLIPVGTARRIAVLYLPNPDAIHTLLFSHGNGEDLGHNRYFLEALRGAGFAVLAYDYRGYGLSGGGAPGEHATYEDIETVYDYATRELAIAPQALLVHGRSVGTGPSVHVAATRPVGGLILESGFTSAFRVLTVVPLFPFDRFPNLRKLREVRAPVLVMHGTRDEVIPHRMGRQLFEAAAEPKASLWIEGAGHNDFADVAGARYWQALRQFSTLVATHASNTAKPKSTPGLR
jgi:abhydrolase domain-containing protein 17